jgi:hypothetical protein
MENWASGGDLLHCELLRIHIDLYPEADSPKPWYCVLFIVIWAVPWYQNLEENSALLTSPVGGGIFAGSLLISHYSCLLVPIASATPPGRHICALPYRPLPPIKTVHLPRLPPQPPPKIILWKIDLHRMHSPSGPPIRLLLRLPLFHPHITIRTLKLTQQPLLQPSKRPLNIPEP